MQWLLKLEMESDPIITCRLMNVFRRKGMKLLTFTLENKLDRTHATALAETDAGAVDHIFNFLRGIAGVRHVAWHSPEATAMPSFILADGGRESASVARLLETFPGSRLVFANPEKCLVEIPLSHSSAPKANGRVEPGWLSFAPVRSTRQEELAVSAVTSAA